MCNFHLVFSLSLMSISLWCIYRVVLTQSLLGSNHIFLSDRSDFHMIDSPSLAVCTFTRYILVLLFVDEMILPSYVILSTHFSGLPFTVEIKNMYSILFVFMWRPISLKYLLHLPSVYGIKCLGEIYKQ